MSNYIVVKFLMGKSKGLEGDETHGEKSPAIKTK